MNKTILKPQILLKKSKH